jgi:hypothetical protein
MNFNKPSKPYKYKSLVDVYTESRQIQENVNIIGVPETGEQEDLGAVTNDEYQKLKRLVLSKADGGVESLVKQLLRLGKWEEISDIDTLVLEIFLQHDIDVQVLNKIVEKKKNGTLGKLESYINKSGVWNLTQAVDPLASKLTKKFDKLFKDLTYKVQPKINTVSVGPGEISLSMFTNATKGDVGDLMLNGMELEIKGDGGRLGSSDYTKAIFTTPGNKFLQILAKRGSGQHFSQAEIPQLRAQLASKATVARKNYDNLYKAAKKFPEIAEQIEGVYKQLDMNLATLEDKKSTIDAGVVMNNIQTAFQAAAQMEQPPLTKAAIANTEFILKILEQITTTNSDKTEYNWQSSTQYMFNHDWGMTARELAEAFVEMRTEEMDAGSVASLTSAAEKVFNKPDVCAELKNLSPAVKGKQKTKAQVELQKLQAALMATSYQSAHGFERIVVLNSQTLAAANIKFEPVHDAGEKFLNVYKQLNNNPGIFVSNPGVDSRNKGIGISVAG